MNTRRAWIIYTVLRLLFFAVPFAVLYFIGWPWWLALVVATLASVSLSVIFLSKPRDAASAGIYEWRTKERTADDIVEDEAVDEAQVEEVPQIAEEAESARNAGPAAGAKPEQSTTRAGETEPTTAADSTVSADSATESAPTTEPPAETR